MKTFLPAVIVIAALSSCTTYQYLTLSSDKTTKNEAKELVWENDTVKLGFNFNGQWGAVKITALNKTEQPFSINWQKSSIVYNNIAYSLFDGSVHVSGDINRNQYYRGPNTTPTQPSATMNASFNMPSTLLFLPPKSSISQQNMNTSGVIPVLNVLPASPVEKVSMGSYTVKYKKAVYDASSAPFRFTLFLTYDAGNGKEFYTQHQFYATEIKQTDESVLYQELINADGDKFYYRLAQ
jgi:hypothetical protein